MKRDYFANFLLFGTFYAAEQASLLLGDANHLFDQGRYSTSLALAVFSREEVGRARIILDEHARVLEGKELPLKALRKQLQSHTGKLKAGLHPVNVHVGLPAAGIVPGRGSEEEQRLAAALEGHRQFQEERAPRETHEHKMRAIYVDLGPTGLHWARPKNLTRGEAFNMLVSAAVEYEALREDLVKSHGSMLAAMSEHSSRSIDLPERVWPSLN